MITLKPETRHVATPEKNDINHHKAAKESEKNDKQWILIVKTPPFGKMKNDQWNFKVFYKKIFTPDLLYHVNEAKCEKRKKYEGRGILKNWDKI